MALDPNALAQAFVATPSSQNPFGDGKGLIPLKAGVPIFVKFAATAGWTYTVSTNELPGNLVVLGPNGLPLNPGIGVSSFPFTPLQSGIYMLEFVPNAQTVAAHQEVTIDIKASNLGLANTYLGGGLQNPNSPTFDPAAGLVGQLPNLINGILGTGPSTTQTVQYFLHAPDGRSNALGTAATENTNQLTTQSTNPISAGPLETANDKPITWVGATDAPGKPGDPIPISISSAMFNYPDDSSLQVAFSHALTQPELNLLVAATHVWESVANVHFNFIQDVSPNNESTQQPADVRVGLADLTKALNQPQMTFVGDTEYQWDANNHFLPDNLVTIQDPNEHPITPLSDGDQQYTGTTATMFQTMIHELGHALGLDENPNDPKSVMNQTLSSKNPLPDSSDIAAIQSLYGAPTQNVAFASQADQTLYQNLIHNAGMVS